MRYLSRFPSLVIVLVSLLLSAGCGAPAPQPAADDVNSVVVPIAPEEATATLLPTQPPIPTVTPEPASVAVEPAATAQPVAEPVPTSTPEPEPDWTQTAFPEDGLYVRGNPDAPIRLIDYSDFF